MSLYTVQQGVRYRAVIALNILEQMVTNDMIRSELLDIGFSDVAVAGSGHLRTAEATWSLPDAAAQVPPQIISVRRIDEQQIASRAERIAPG